MQPIWLVGLQALIWTGRQFLHSPLNCPPTFKYSPHQRLDLIRLFEPVTKWSREISAVNTAALINKAIEISTTPRPGSVHMSLPSDIARTEDRISPEMGDRWKRREETQAAKQGGREIAGEISKSEYPVIIVGIGVEPRETQRPIQHFIENTGIPALVTPKAKGALFRRSQM